MSSYFVRILYNLESYVYYQRNADPIKKTCLRTDCDGLGFHEAMMRIYFEIQWRTDEYESCKNANSIACDALVDFPILGHIFQISIKGANSRNDRLCRRYTMALKQ